MRARALVVVAAILIAVLGGTRPAEATECFDQMLNDFGLCLGQRDRCLESSSFWTRTCNLEYLACAAGAEIAYVDCNMEALAKLIDAVRPD